ncbi:hypothetical protein MA04_02791 [Alcanivorax balearicus MACL04]|uniref:O-antigen polymerase n=1 Tax=Alloalcanivorax balearicus MACL04 TaxID=1177182 RepID=A0ABT2R132_9GAMM|nr:hypothetical protein [Alloalcanivorax balearicus MACL04]
MFVISASFYKKDSKLGKAAKWLSLISAIVVIFYAQSKTAFVVFLFGVLLTYALQFRGRIKIISLLWQAPLAAFFTLYIFMKVMEFGYLSKVFTEGLDSNSYVSRIEKWSYLFDMAIKEPYWFLSGFGKSYFGEYAGAMDNEYVFMFLVYGVVFFLVYISFILFMMYEALRNYSHIRGADRFLVLSFMVVTMVGLIAAWPSMFVTNLKTAFLFVVSMVLAESIIRQRSTATASKIGSNPYRSAW